MNIYSEKSRIKSYHVDKNGKLSTVQVFNFLQEAAFQHSVIDKFGQPDLDKLGLVWILSRMKVQFLSEVVLGEVVEINSWVRSIKGALSERDFELICNGIPVIRATSLWVCLDVRSVRPVTIPENITQRMEVNESRALPLNTSKITAVKNADNCSSYSVQPSDIDMVGHTNNVSYVRMVMDTLDYEKKPTEVAVNYLNQSFKDDLLTINSIKTTVAQISEITNNSGELICRIRCL